MNLYHLLILTIFSLHHVRAECNGGPSLCNQSYSDITHLVTHDSYALFPNIAATQDTTIVQQLIDGVRGIKLSAVPSANDPSIIHLCHTYCRILDAGSVQDTLNNITAWLESNPKEVVTIMWNNLYNLKAEQFATVYNESKIFPFVYTPSSNETTWPTLQQMIDSGKRVVNFIDAEADQENVPWLIDQFSNVFETPYENTDRNAFNCDVDRIHADANPKDLMYVMNHFIYGVIDIASIKVEVPLKKQAQYVNAEASLLDHANQCSEAFQKKPNYIEVDFYSTGDTLDVIAKLNGVTPKPRLLNKALNENSRVASLVKILSPTDHVFIDNSINSGASQLIPGFVFFVIVISLLF